MDVPFLLFALFLAVVAFLLANSRTLLSDEMMRERFVHNGILTGPGTPGADAPEGFVRRLRQRERRAAGVSAVALVPGFFLLPGLPDPMAAFPVFVSLAFAGRFLGLAVMGAREASDPDGGPRLSRGRVVTLADHVPLWALGVLVALQVAFVVAAAVWVTGPAWHPWGLVAGLGVTVACLALASWLARQPQRAGDRAELAWSDAVRREDVVALVLLGPLVTMALGTLLLGGEATQGPVGILVWANIAVVFAAVALVGAASTRRARSRLSVGDGDDARR